jgi:uroporphyrinogen-III synthase
MTESVTIWRVAGVVDALAAELDMLSRRKDLSLRLMAVGLQTAVETANAEIRGIIATDKPRLETISDRLHPAGD